MDYLDDEPWQKWRNEWDLDGSVTYLNHGSFGPSPRVVQQERERWSRELECQPMAFFVDRLEQQLDDAAKKLGALIGASPDDFVFQENATQGMNVVANSVPLNPGDEILLSDHEYGAVHRIWNQRSETTGAKVVVGRLNLAADSPAQLANEFLAQATDRTRLIVVSHVTSPTATILPVHEICDRAQQRDIAICIDGPHALAMLPLNIAKLGCDYYVASGHKWLSAPFGTGFLFVAKRNQQKIRPVITSWGHSVSGRPHSWKHEFNWPGTRDFSSYLVLPAAIDFLQQVGLEEFRLRTHALAQYARERIVELTGLQPGLPDSPSWYGSMVTLPLPGNAPKKLRPGSVDPLQTFLRHEQKIEIPVLQRNGRRFIRVSCHLYNTTEDIDRLVNALKALSPSFLP